MGLLELCAVRAVVKILILKRKNCKSYSPQVRLEVNRFFNLKGFQEIMKDILAIPVSSVKF